MITIDAISRPRTPRASVPARGTIPPGETILLGSKIIIDAVSANMKSGYRLWPDDAVRMATTQIVSDQRFFQVELNQAAEQLAVAFPTGSAPYGTDELTWQVLLGNNFGGRVVPITACRPGFVMDSVSRRCVAERRTPLPKPTPSTPTPEPAQALLLPEPKEAKAGTPILLVAAIGVIAFLLFR